MFKNYIKDYKKTVIFTITFILFIILTILLIKNNNLLIDKSIETNLLNIRNKNLTNIMITITNIGSAYFLILISIIISCLNKFKEIRKKININLISIFTISQILKQIIRRPRPIGINLVTANGFSYPSGHSMVSMAYFGFLVYLIYKNYNKNKYKKIIIITTLTVIPLLIGISRIYLGVHYLSDVIGGFLLSIAYLMIYIKLNNKSEVIKWKQSE